MRNTQDLIGEARRLAESDEYPPCTQFFGEVAGELERLAKKLADANAKLLLVNQIMFSLERSYDKVKALEPGKTVHDAILIELWNALSHREAKIRENTALRREVRLLRGEVGSLIFDDDGEAD